MAVPQDTRILMRALEDLGTLKNSLNLRFRDNKPRVVNVLKAIEALSGELSNLLTVMAQDAKIPPSKFKEELQAESERRTSGQIGRACSSEGEK